jgi:hypothetical protein
MGWSHLTGSPREAWFRRAFLWGSVPIHWKGEATLVVGLAIVLPSFFLGMAFSKIHQILSVICFAVAGGAFVSIWVFAERHMEPRQLRGLSGERPPVHKS